MAGAHRVKADQSLETTDRTIAFRWAYIVWPWMLVFIAWSSILLAFSTNQAYLIDHDYLLRASHLPLILSLLLFLALWQIMIMAMMLPSTLPLLSVLAYTSQPLRHLWRRQTAFIAGYALIWTAFALLAFLGDTLLHRLVNNWFWLYTHPWMISATLFAVTGAYQFSPLKAGCLKRCCNAADFQRRYSRQGSRSSWRLGLRYGTYCLASCWALMLVMFGVGIRGLLWIAMLTAVMLVEKGVPGGHRFRYLIGTGFLLLATVWLVFPWWL